jgi:N-acetylmuramoyl-L-alanine amidase
MVKGMKVCFRSKTKKATILTIPFLVLTMFYGFGQSQVTPAPYKIHKIVIDAGHGGKDPGCHGNNSKEKDIALAVALNLGQKIKCNFPDIKVIYTRDTDVFIPLNERAAIANRNQADLFISIHCNYIGVRNRATGTETYVLGLYRAEDNLDVAKRENAAILLEDDYEKTYNGFDPYSTEGHIILSMFQNAHLEQSISFATQVQNQVKKFSDLNSRGVKQAGFLVLRETTMPSVLIETGFLSTDLDENYLIKKENQDEMAMCIFKAFSQYKKDMEEPDPATGIVKAEKPDTTKPQVLTSFPGNSSPPQAPSSETVIYRIQIAASSKSAVDSRYQALEDLEIIKENDLYKFVVGRFTSPDAARARLSALKASGFEGAFIKAFREGTYPRT